MSLTGRYIIDRMKRSMGQYLKFPVPPYGASKFWDDAYKSIDVNDVQEWGQIKFQHIYQYEYELFPIPTTILPAAATATTTTTTTVGSNDGINEKIVVTDIRETLGLDNNKQQDGKNTNNPILIVGCGNSKFGEDMVEARLQYPLIQVDVANSIIERMTYRCQQYIENGDMQIILDDATELSTLNDNKITAAIDKGLADALFCADEYQQCYDMMYSIHRVLQPNGIVCIFSFSRPEFILPRLLMRTTTTITGQQVQFDPYQQVKALRSMWTSVQVRKINSGIFVYRFQKASSTYNYNNTNNFITTEQTTMTRNTILNPNSKNR